MSLSGDVLDKIVELASGVCQREGCELYDIEWVSGSKGAGRALRVYVDRQDQAVSLQDCENVSRGLNLLLDVEDVIPGGEYSLEVSSPGMERVLRKPNHFSRAVGKTIHLKANESIYEYNPQIHATVKRMNAKGELLAAEENGIVLKVDGVEMKVPYAIIDKAQVVWNFDADKGQKKGK